MGYDPTGHEAISSIIISLAISSLITLILTETFGAHIAGGVGSVAGGVAAISTGISLCAYGKWGIAAGVLLMIIGAGTIALGANEVVTGATGINYIQSWTGWNDPIYSGVYIGLNIASSVGAIAGSVGMQFASNRILNNIIKNPASVQNYSIWQMKTFGKYTSQFTSGVMQRSKSNPGGGYTLTNKVNASYGYIQYHPGGSRWHFNGAAYWKVTSSFNPAWRGLYLY